MWMSVPMERDSARGAQSASVSLEVMNAVCPGIQAVPNRTCVGEWGPPGGDRSDLSKAKGREVSKPGFATCYDSGRMWLPLLGWKSSSERSHR